ncbi:hypothetical protein GJ496_009161 [Pomphorhynchus laevis]|nr:hypothetical protein GJ496_009161 [Pomphorhynchus laevis]
MSHRLISQITRGNLASCIFRQSIIRGQLAIILTNKTHCNRKQLEDRLRKLEELEDCFRRIMHQSNGRPSLMNSLLTVSGIMLGSLFNYVDYQNCLVRNSFLKAEQDELNDQLRSLLAINSSEYNELLKNIRLLRNELNLTNSNQLSFADKISISESLLKYMFSAGMNLVKKV